MPGSRRREVIVVATLSLKKGVCLREAKAEVRDRVNAECGDPGRRAIRIKRLTRYNPAVAALPQDTDCVSLLADLEAGKNVGREAAATLRQIIADRDQLQGRLKDIGDFAHDRSTGPTVPDDLWEIRRMAYDL